MANSEKSFLPKIINCIEDGGAFSVPCERGKAFVDCLIRNDIIIRYYDGETGNLVRTFRGTPVYAANMLLVLGALPVREEKRK